MRVLILHSRYLSGPASGENHAVEADAELLRRAGHAVETWTPAPEIDGGGAALRAGVGAAWSRSATRRVATLVDRFRPDVVHVHNLFPVLSPAVIRTCAGLGLPVVMTLHNYRFMCLPGNLLRDGRICEDCLGHLPWRGVAHRCYRGSLPASAALATAIASHRLIGTFDRVQVLLAAGSYVRDKHNEAGLLQGRIRTKPQFAWPTRRRGGPGEYFLYLGRLAQEKGVRTLIEAWRMGAPGPLLVVGDGPEAARLRASSPETVEFRGSVSGSETSAIVRRARAVLVPSIWYEGGEPPLVAVEAFAAGVPVVASRIGALPRVVHDETAGLLASPGDAADWLRAARRLCDDGLSERLGAGAWRTWDMHHRPERALAELERAYADAEAAIRRGG